MSGESHYDRLGVGPDATREQIREAYRVKVEGLKAARDAKNVSAPALQENRAEVARLDEAWNVLSDPFQRQRYDQASSVPTNDDVELVDDPSSEGAEAQQPALTGWRRLMTPAPAPRPGDGGKGGRSGGGGPTPPRRGRVPQAPMPLPPGMHMADTRTRGMASLTDFAVIIIFATLVPLLAGIYGPWVNDR
jgi:curved DNA-binding protein CbpA